MPLGFEASSSFSFLVLLCSVLHILIRFPGGVLQDKDRKLIVGSCLCSHVPSEKKKKENSQGMSFLSEPLFEGQEDRNALGSQAENFKRNLLKCNITNIWRDF